MRNHLPHLTYSKYLLAACLVLAARHASAFQFLGAAGQGQAFGQVGQKAQLGEGDRVPTMEAGFTKPGPDGAAQLFIEATMPEGAHTYSITQPEGGPTRTKIKVESSAKAPKIGKFHTVGKPKVTRDDSIFPVPMEEQSGKVKWFAPIKLAAGTKPESLKIEGKVYMQLCDENGCAMPKDYAFTATYQPKVEPEKEPKETPASKPATKPESPTAAKGTGAGANTSAVPPTANSPKGGNANSATAQVKWRRFTSVSDLHDLIGGNFDAEAIRANVQHSDTQLSLGRAILFGLLGGLILNIMPCVLPVIGLKIVSFVQQSGHNRAKAFALNVWYSAGLLAVFLILASLAVGPQKLGWGQLFAETWFPITLSAVIFVMGLSFMGVWEVPLPAFLGGGRAGQLAAQEGALRGLLQRRFDDAPGYAL